MLLGYSQVTVLPVAQLASLVGVFGVSALVAGVSAALVDAAVRRTLAPAVSAAILLGAVVAWGSARASRAELVTDGQPLRVGLIQGNVDQGLKWDQARSAAIFASYLAMTRDAIGRGATLVIWPESSTPFRYEEDAVGAAEIRSLARQAHVSLIFGSDQLEWRAAGTRRIPDKAYNSAFLVRSDGETGGTYRKMHLVPWGEYVPLKQWLSFVGPLVEAIGTGFAAGDEATLLRVAGHPVSVAICYEVIYPELVRKFVAEGSELLTTITNDAWFGTTSAPYQHFEQASMRAIEEGRFLVRAANTGISGIVDPYGRVLARTELLRPAALVGDARFLRASTFYGRHGDWLAYTATVVTLIVMAIPTRVKYLDADPRRDDPPVSGPAQARR